jgi:hypothetical protein
MKLFERNAGKKTRGQTMVEFALVLPILLVTMYGVMEFGRLLFIYVTTTSASREAARYASGVELVDRGGVLVERFRDCEGIRDAAMRVGLLAGLQSGDIDIRYDLGPADTRTWNQLPQCPNSVSLGNRVKVAVTGHFQPIVPLVPWSDEVLQRFANIRSETARTIIRNVEVGPNFQPPPQQEEGEPPFFRFDSYSSWIYEHDYNDVPYIATVRVYNADNVPEAFDEEIQIMFNLYGEAVPGDYQLLTTSPLVIPAGQESANIELYINDDDLYEYLERIIIVLEEVLTDNASRRQPWAHVIYIQDNDTPPPVYFLQPDENWINCVEWDIDDAFEVTVELGMTGQAASVGFGVSGTAQRDNEYFIHTDSGTDRLYFPYNPGTDSVDRWEQIRITPNLENLPGEPKTIILELEDAFNAYLDPADLTRPTILTIDFCTTP